MPNLDEFFRTQDEPLHPRLRDWSRRLANKRARATLEVFRPRGEFGPGQPEMAVQFYLDGQPEHLDTLPWDDDLNDGLIRLRVRSINSENEGERFALALQAALRNTEREFGDGYFNAVLVELITESDLTRYKPIAEVMQYAYANKPHREGGAFGRYNTCRDMIAEAISTCAKELRDLLGYSQEDAKPILVSAIAQYLDERFSVTSRKQLGLL
jgi:hypothetical protein